MNARERQSPNLNEMTLEELQAEKLKVEIQAARKPRAYQYFQPYLILLATALISGYLVPRITRAWQDYEKELQLKADLVTEVSDIVARFVSAIQTVEVAEMRKSQYDSSVYLQASQDWDVDVSRISAKFSAYFPHTAIPAEWSEFTDIVGEVYALTHTNVSEYRAQRIDRIRAYFDSDAVDWDSLRTPVGELPNLNASRSYEAAWFSLRNQVLNAKDKLIEKMLSHSTSLTNR